LSSQRDPAGEKNQAAQEDQSGNYTLSHEVTPLPKNDILLGEIPFDTI
jgi:hypothetical protein